MFMQYICCSALPAMNCIMGYFPIYIILLRLQRRNEENMDDKNAGVDIEAGYRAV